MDNTPRGLSFQLQASSALEVRSEQLIKSQRSEINTLKRENAMFQKYLKETRITHNADKLAK